MLTSLTRRPVSHSWRLKTITSIHMSRNSSTSVSTGGPVLSDPEKIRNIALLAHIDSGKTTLTESILTASSYKSSAGTVDTGSTTTDFLPAERERGITIQSASIPVSWRQWTYNLIDTPGHADFGMEVESASRVIDGAVVLLDAVEGVESQTKGVWNQLDRHQVPTRFMFVNKLDRPGASLSSSISSILAHRLHPSPTLLTLPIASFDQDHYKRGEPGIEGLVDLVKWEVWKWPVTQSAESNHPPERIPLPITESELNSNSIFSYEHPLLKELLSARESLLDNLSLRSPELESALLDAPPEASPYLAVGASQIISSLRSLVARQDILPVFCGAAAKHIGTGLLLDYVGELLASPRDVRLEGAIESGSDVQMLAWKVAWDKRKGWMTFVRVYSGSLTRNVTLVNTATREKERISKILLLYADEPREVDSLPFGSVGVLLGLKHTRTGDTLVAAALDQQSHRQHKSPKGKASLDQPQSSQLAMGSITPPPAVISASVIPQAHADIQPVAEALLSLSRTDPSLRITEDTTEGQTLVHGLGALHLEIAEGRLKEEWGVRASFGKRRVTYREGFVGDAVEVDEVMERDVAGARASARVRLLVRSLTQEEVEGDSAWGGNIVSSRDGTLLQAPTMASDTTAPVDPTLLGIQTALSASPHTSLALTRAHITILEAPPTSITNPLAAGAATQALRTAIVEAGPGSLMEPFVNVGVRVGEEAVGKVVKDLTECGGEIVDLGLEAINDAEVGVYDTSNVYIPPSIVSPASGVSNASKVGSIGVKRTVHAVAPLSRMLDYSNRLRALSAGTGQFEMASAGFREVNDIRRREILIEIGRA
ncbi:P-loop containing nucleoside triphosphate hydrolase protein [Rhizoctonia solani]|uniref:P-loop containing nucleoside triphosphate hydrolase protein n=1 Tax=Rhizoctonia solani TaxID=456999 RepID=A0A8H7HAI5_9AGAM|nr:P-loop containing nucleoside triphosphate hydrolase protein [Rhizoctonia solani]